MLILNTVFIVIGMVVSLVALMWGISTITAHCLLAYHDWKENQNSST